MTIPAPYIPQTVNPFANVSIQPVTAQDMMAVQIQREQLQGAQLQNRLASMIEQETMADKKVQRLAASHAVLQNGQAPAPAANRLSIGPAVAPQASMADANPLGVAAPQASGAPGEDPIHQAFITDRDNPGTPDVNPDSDSPYEVHVPNRAPRSWLMQQARDGKIDPQAAIKYDAETQAMVQQQTALYEEQGKQYGSIIGPEVDTYVKNGDMKGLRGVMEKMKKELPNNPLARAKADHAISFIENGGTFGEGGITSYPVVVTEANQKVVQQKYMEAGGDPRMTPVPGETWSFTDQKGKTVRVVQDVAGVGKEPTTSQAMWIKGRVAELMKSGGMRREQAETQASEEYENRLDKRKENNTRVTVQLRTDAKDKTDAKKEARKTGDPNDMQMMVADYIVTGKQPTNMRDAATQRQFRREANKMLKQYGMDPMTWAKSRVDARAATHALNKVQEVNTKTNQLEETANKLLDRAIEQHSSLKLGKTRKINDWLNHAKANWQGDPKTRTIEGTIYEALVDYGRVMSGNTSQGGITDSARAEAEKLLSAADNREAFLSIVENMKKTMSLRQEANRSVESALNQRISGQFSSGGADAGGGKKIGRFVVEEVK